MYIKRERDRKRQMEARREGGEELLSIVNRTYSTVRDDEITTGMSKAIERVPIFSFAIQGGHHVSFHVQHRNSGKLEKMTFHFLRPNLSLIVEHDPMSDSAQAPHTAK